MAYQTFSLPVAASPEQAEVLNAFLRGHSVAVVRKEWVAAGPESFWAFCVEYQEFGAGSAAGRRAGVAGKVDYREVLTADQFAVFADLRILRKALAKRWMGMSRRLAKSNTLRLHPAPDRRHQPRDGVRSRLRQLLRAHAVALCGGGGGGSGGWESPGSGRRGVNGGFPVESFIIRPSRRSRWGLAGGGGNARCRFFSSGLATTGNLKLPLIFHLCCSNAQ